MLVDAELLSHLLHVQAKAPSLQSPSGLAWFQDVNCAAE